MVLHRGDFSPGSPVSSSESEEPESPVERAPWEGVQEVIVPGPPHVIEVGRGDFRVKLGLEESQLVGQELDWIGLEFKMGKSSALFSFFVGVISDFIVNGVLGNDVGLEVPDEGVVVAVRSELLVELINLLILDPLLFLEIRVNLPISGLFISLLGSQQALSFVVREESERCDSESEGVVWVFVVFFNLSEVFSEDLESGVVEGSRNVNLELQGEILEGNLRGGLDVDVEVFWLELEMTLGCKDERQ